MSTTVEDTPPPPVSAPPTTTTNGNAPPPPSSAKTPTPTNGNADSSMISGQQRDVLGARLDGFPVNVMEMDIALYLSSLLYVGKIQSDGYYYSITKVFETTTTSTTAPNNIAVVADNNTKSVLIALYCNENPNKMFQQLSNKLKKQLFRSTYPILAYKCNLETGIIIKPKNKKKKKRNNKKNATTNDDDASKDKNNNTTNGSNGNKNKKEQIEPQQQQQQQLSGKDNDNVVTTTTKKKKSRRRKKGTNQNINNNKTNHTNNNRSSNKNDIITEQKQNDVVVTISNDILNNNNNNHNSSNNKTKKHKKKRFQQNVVRKNFMNEMTTMAMSFHKYLLENPAKFQRCSATRDDAHYVFEEFYYNHNSTRNNNNNTLEQQQQQQPAHLLYAEAMVMARLRQKKLLRTKRRGDVVIMNFAIDGTPGNFEDMQTVIDKQQQQQQAATIPAPAGIAAPTTSPGATGVTTTGNISENGVIVQFVGGPPGFQIMDHNTVDFVIKAGEIHQVDLNIRCCNDNNHSSNKDKKKRIYLDKLQLVGLNQKFFSMVHNHLPHLPIEIYQSEKHLAIHVSVKPPTRVGVFRASLESHFRVVVEDDPSTNDNTEGTDEKEKTLLFTIVRHFKVKSTHDKNIEQLLQPNAPYTKFHRKPRVRKHRRNRNQREEGKNVLGPPAQEYTYENPFKQVPFHSIQPEIVDMILAGELGTILDRSFLDNENDGNNENITIDGTYSTFWKNILWAYEFQLESDMELFDMENVQLQHDTSNAKYLAMTVPGLAESRPSVLRGDYIDMQWNGRKYKGRVQDIQLLDIIFESHASFHKSFNPKLDVIDTVRFVLNRMIFRIMHNNLTMNAEHIMKDILLIPSQKHVETIKSSGASESNSRLSLSSSSLFTWANRDLNTEQQNAVARIVQGSYRPLPYIIFGPPGTGKTTTVVEATYQLAKHSDGKMKILLTAPSNEAADLLAERLSTFFPPSELRRIISYSRSIDTVPDSIRSYVCTEENSPEKQLHDIMSARIVVSTLALASRFTYWGVPRGYFDVMVVDEAGQATEPELISVASTLMSFTNDSSSGESTSVGQLILAGDPRQLGPIVTSDLCRKFKLDVSYLERLMNRSAYGRQSDGHYPENLLTKLVRNYRSHPSIMKLPNQMFYDNELECCADHMSSHSLDKWEYIPSKGFPVVFHAVEGENLRESNSPSWFNPQEAELVVEYVKLLMRETRPPLTCDEIGIITPYQRQAQKIRQVLNTLNIHDIQVGSVESFQGRERRCIIVSTVRSESEHISSDLKYNLGFVANEKRFNVVMTRAKALLIVIGCPKVLSYDKDNWLPFLRYCRENNSWIGEDWDLGNAMNVPEVTDVNTGNTQDHEEEWEVVAEHAKPSQTAEQSAFPIIRREE